MKKITVITLQNIRNYGSVLQAVATQKVFENIGCDVDFFDYSISLSSSKTKRIKQWIYNRGVISKIVYPLILIPTFIRQDRLFELFLKKHLHTIPGRLTCIDDFNGIVLNSDIYCTGSDQTWNSDWNQGVRPELFLSFVPDNIKKISYAASIGKSHLDDCEIVPTREYLKRYSAISVREASAKEIVEQQLGLPSATHVLDPTLQVNREFWISFLGKDYKPKYENGKYVLIYQLNTNPQFDAYTKEFAKRKGWKLIRFCTRYDQIFKCGKAELIPDVENFIGLIANAGCVITDSFHATAFCCNMNTPMICIYPNEFSSRLASILKLVGLENRHLTDYNDFSFVDNTEVDFTNVNEILERERQVGWDFLKKAIDD